MKSAAAAMLCEWVKNLEKGDQKEVKTEDKKDKKKDKKGRTDRKVTVD